MNLHIPAEVAHLVAQAQQFTGTHPAITGGVAALVAVLLAKPAYKTSGWTLRRGLRLTSWTFRSGLRLASRAFGSKQTPVDPTLLTVREEVAQIAALLEHHDMPIGYAAKNLDSQLGTIVTRLARQFIELAPRCQSVDGLARALRSERDSLIEALLGPGDNSLGFVTVGNFSAAYGLYNYAYEGNSEGSLPATRTDETVIDPAIAKLMRRALLTLIKRSTPPSSSSHEVLSFLGLVKQELQGLKCAGTKAMWAHLEQSPTQNSLPVNDSHGPLASRLPNSGSSNGHRRQQVSTG